VSDDPSENYKQAQQAVNEAINSLRIRSGKKPIAFTVTDPDEKAIPPICSFCGKGSNQVRKMVNGITGNICDECIQLATDILESE